MTAHNLALPSLHDARILLVDDDPGAIQSLGKLLAGYRELRFATGGNAALTIAKLWQPELVLLDVQMPGTDGFAVCRALKADPLLADVPVIFVTQHGEPEVEAAAYEIGAADLISKPVSGPILLARVALQLRLHRMAAQLARMKARDSLAGPTGVGDLEPLDAVLAWRDAGGRRRGWPLAAPLSGPGSAFVDQLGCEGVATRSGASRGRW